MCKSFILLDLALAIVGGGSFLGQKVSSSPGSTVLYVGGEGRKRALDWRLSRLANGRLLHFGDIGSRLHLSICPDIDLATGKNLDTLRRAIDSIEPTPTAIMLDPLTRLHSAEENSRDAVEPMLNSLNRIVEDYQTCLIVAHHSRKNSSQYGADALRGSSAFRGWYDSLVQLEPVAGEERIRKLTAEHRDAEPFGPIHIRLTVSETCETAELQLTEGPTKEGSGRDRRSEVATFLLANGPKSGRAIREHLRCSNNTLKKILAGAIGETIDGVQIQAVTDDNGRTIYRADRPGEKDLLNDF